MTRRYASIFVRYRGRVRVTRTHDTKAAARRWLRQQVGEVSKGRLGGDVVPVVPRGASHGPAPR